MRLNLPEIAEAYRYVPPEPVAQTKPPFDFGDLRLDIARSLEGFYLSEPKQKSAKFRYKNVLPDPADPKRHLVLSLSAPARRGEGELGVRLDQYMDRYNPTFVTGACELIYDLSPNFAWENIHRVTMPDDRRRGVMSTFEDWAELVARTHAFKTGNVVRLWANPFQLDVVDFFLARDFKPSDPSTLQRVVVGTDLDLSLGYSDESDGRRDWCVYSYDDLLRIKLEKTIAPPKDLLELQTLNKTI